MAAKKHFRVVFLFFFETRKHHASKKPTLCPFFGRLLFSNMPLVRQQHCFASSFL